MVNLFYFLIILTLGASLHGVYSYDNKNLERSVKLGEEFGGVVMMNGYCTATKLDYKFEEDKELGVYLTAAHCVQDKQELEEEANWLRKQNMDGIVGLALAYYDKYPEKAEMLLRKFLREEKGYVDDLQNELGYLCYNEFGLFLNGSSLDQVAMRVVYYTFLRQEWKGKGKEVSLIELFDKDVIGIEEGMEAMKEAYSERWRDDLFECEVHPEFKSNGLDLAVCVGKGGNLVGHKVADRKGEVERSSMGIGGIVVGAFGFEAKSELELEATGKFQGVMKRPITYARARVHEIGNSPYILKYFKCEADKEAMGDTNSGDSGGPLFFYDGDRGEYTIIGVYRGHRKKGDLQYPYSRICSMDGGIQAGSPVFNRMCSGTGMWIPVDEKFINGAYEKLRERIFSRGDEAGVPQEESSLHYEYQDLYRILEYQDLFNRKRNKLNP